MKTFSKKVPDTVKQPHECDHKMEQIENVVTWNSKPLERFIKKKCFFNMHSINIAVSKSDWNANCLVKQSYSVCKIVWSIWAITYHSDIILSTHYLKRILGT